MIISLNYFNNIVRIESSSKYIINRINYIFKEFVYDDKEKEIAIYFKVEPNDINEIHELVSSNEKFIILYSYNGFDYLSWKFNDTFLPPMRINPFADKFLVLHGCAVRYNNKTIAFLAPSMAGKTSLLLYLVSKKFQAITDDLLFIDVFSEMVFPYKKPVGVREKSLNIIPNLECMLIECLCNETMSFKNLEGYKTWLVHLNDLFKKDVYYDKSSKIDIFIKIDQTTENKIDKGSTFETYNYIINSICNSGLSDENLNNSILKLVTNSSFYNISTGNLEFAYIEIMKLLDN